MSNVFIDMTGQMFGRLTVLKRVANTKAGQARWACRCSCGAETVVAGIVLRHGRSRSCGCLRGAGTGRPRNPVVTYDGAHMRIYRERGKAKYYACVDCGATAQDWSYDRTDPDELTGEVVTPDGRPIMVPYSMKPEHYSPRCKSCHIRLDRRLTTEGAIL